MNSISIMPPRNRLIDQKSSTASSRSILSRMSATAQTSRSGSRSRVSAEAMVFSMRAANASGAAITLARVSARCSQVQASSF